MQLISLQISGFKSFANETKIQFAPGVTGVVGPNGCGKSNVVDSLRWVLGEQRSSVLRGDRMESVIFNGTAKRKALNLAEVKVKFDNSSARINLPYSEIEIARRLHRDGTSEYLINGNSCRLRDITDMLQDSGLGPNAYTILELKMIEDILRDDGEGRRQLFEEASGIAKYKLRRRQALAKLAQTDEDLLRLADIISEVERQVASLKRQVGKARRYQELSAELKKVEIAFSVHEFDRLQREVEPLRHALTDALGHAEGSTSHLRQFEAKVESLRLQHMEGDQRLAELRSELQETVSLISALEAEKAGAEARLFAAKEALDRAQRQIVLANDRLQSLASRKDSLTLDKDQTEKELREAKSRLEASEGDFQKSQAEMKRLETAYREADAQLATLNRTQASLEGERARLLEGIARQKGRRESAHMTRDQLSKEKVDLESRISIASNQARELACDVDRSVSELNECEAQGEDLRKRQIALASRLDEADRLLHATQSHIKLLETLDQRGPRGTAQIRLLRDRYDKYQLIADRIVVESKYSMAIHAALGGAAYHLLVNSENELHEAVGLLVDQEAGKCGFMLPWVVSQHTEVELPAGVIGWASGLVSLSEDDQGLLNLITGCIVVSTFKEALLLRDYLAKHRFRAVTLEGDWVDWTGACFAGSVQIDAPTDLGLKQHLESLQMSFEDALRDKEQVLEQSGLLASEFDVWNSSRSEIAGVLETRKAALGGIESEVLRLNTLLHALEERDKAALQLISESEEAEQVLRMDVEKHLTAINESRSAIESAQKLIEKLSEDVWQARQANDNSRDSFHEHARHVESIIHRVQLLAAEEDRLLSSESELVESIASSRNQAEAAANVISSTEVRLKDITAELRTLFLTRDARLRVVEDAQRQRDSSTSEVRQLEDQLKRLRTSREAALDDQRKIEVSIAKMEGEIESLLTSARNQHGIDLAADFENAKLSEYRGVESSADLIAELRGKIESLGTVNLLAVEEYDKETARLEGILANRADLLAAKATLEETIGKINETAEAKFLHTFEAVRANFQSLFTEFFPAGEADLILSGKDLLEADITMWANPSGKRLKSLTLMSGGEKTMTAIALLFSLYQVKPSPFCVLDEVDAPLDDANIDRFTRMIHRHSDHTQFIMITHNKRTMEIADNLYGVTMQEEGVSKTVSVRLMKPEPAIPAEARVAAT